MTVTCPATEQPLSSCRVATAPPTSARRSFESRPWGRPWPGDPHGTSSRTSPRCPPATPGPTCGPGPICDRADVDVAEIYDGFSFLTLSWLEGLGLCPVGGSGPFVEGGERIALDGELPLNTQGGQLSGGRLHGYGFLHEAALQLWGEAEGRQVADDPEVAVVAAGGGNTCGCLLLVRDS